SGYTLSEKSAIAQQFLVPKQLEKHGLEAHSLTFDLEAIRQMIEMYTREAGVRSLEREIAAVARKLARKVVQSKPEQPLVVNAGVVAELLGKPRFRPRRKNERSEIGAATGLAWTEVGGELLETEIGLMKGKGKLTLTGKLGDVMQESASDAVSPLC